VAAEAPPKPEAPAAKPGAPSASAKEGGESGSASAGREPKDYSGWVGRGDQLLKKGDLSGAQQAFQQAVTLRGTGSEANSGLGSALLAQGQTREAIPYLTRAAGNGFAEASVALGDAYRKLGQKDAAVEAYETYLARLPKGARASYVKLQLEGLGQDVGGSKAAPSEPAAPPASDYRPAGELNEPPAEPKPPTEPAQ
jgi:tetratricopeptide (TPR) repeat protein